MIADCARFLARARCGGPPTPAPPPELAPSNEAQGYAVQAALHDLLAGAGFGRRTGHKIGCTTPVMQAFLGIDHPCAGGIFSSMVFENHVTLPLSGFHRIGVECEIAARLGADIAGDCSRDCAADAVSSLMAAIELVEDRYVDYSTLPTPVLVADDFFNAGAVLGPERTDWRALDPSAARGTLIVNGRPHASGLGADIFGDPMAALAWLANHRAARGAPLQAGEFVMLGSVVQTVFFDEPADIVVELAGLGRASVTFA